MIITLTHMCWKTILYFTNMHNFFGSLKIKKKIQKTLNSKIMINLNLNHRGPSPVRLIERKTEGSGTGHLRCPTCHISVLQFESYFWLLVLASKPWKLGVATVMARVSEFLPSGWEPWFVFLISAFSPGSTPAVMGIWGVIQWVRAVCLLNRKIKHFKKRNIAQRPILNFTSGRV